MQLRKKLFLVSLAGLGINLLLGGGLLIFSSAGAQTPISQPAGESNRTLPEFSLDDLAGNSHTISDLAGKPAVINFWASWCGPCEQEMPLLQSYADAYPEVYFIGINSGEDASLVEPFIDRYDITFSVWLDLDEKVTDQLRIIGLPTTYFIDSDGVIQDAHLGQLTPALLNQYLLRLGIEP